MPPLKKKPKKQVTITRVSAVSKNVLKEIEGEVKRLNEQIGIDCNVIQNLKDEISKRDAQIDDYKLAEHRMLSEIATSQGRCNDLMHQLDTTPRCIMEFGGLNWPSQQQFIRVAILKEMSLFELAMEIKDPDIQKKATEAIADANHREDAQMLSRLKARVLTIIGEQK